MIINYLILLPSSQMLKVQKNANMSKRKYRANDKSVKQGIWRTTNPNIPLHWWADYLSMRQDLMSIGDKEKTTLAPCNYYPACVLKESYGTEDGFVLGVLADLSWILTICQHWSLDQLKRESVRVPSWITSNSIVQELSTHWVKYSKCWFFLDLFFVFRGIHMNNMQRLHIESTLHSVCGCVREIWSCFVSVCVGEKEWYCIQGLHHSGNVS